MGSDPGRTWTLYEHPQFGWRVNEVFGDLDLAKSARKNDWPVIEVVEESRLREAEAESEKRQVLIDVCCKNHDRQAERAREAEARAERLEAELREAAASFDELAIYLHPLPEGGHARLGEACGVDACILCLAETRAKEARDRVRGVLEKGTGNTENA